MKWLQLNCLDSVETMWRSGKTSAKRSMRKRLGREKPSPNSSVNRAASVGVTSTVGKGRVILEGGYTFSTDRDNGTPTSEWLRG